MRVTASVLCEGWADVEMDDRLVFGVPEWPYVMQAFEAGPEGFAAQVEALAVTAYEVRQVKVFADIDALTERHNDLVAAEAVLAHAEWFDKYADR